MMLLGNGNGDTLEHGDATSRWEVGSGGRMEFVASEDTLG